LLVTILSTGAGLDLGLFVTGIAPDNKHMIIYYQSNLIKFFTILCINKISS